MEAIITIVGFLGAGKTTLLNHLVMKYTMKEWSPFVILNDYENASMDVSQLNDKLDPRCIKALSGSCICCSGILELRDFVNQIPERVKGVTLIEANGTSDAVELMGFLGVGIEDRFLPPVQVSVVDAKNWQMRGEDNILEANQVQVSSLIVLSHLDKIDDYREISVRNELKSINPTATIITLNELDVESLPQLTPSQNKATKLDHKKAHWASSSCDLPPLPDPHTIKYICDAIPSSILRVKGVTKIAEEEHYTYFERVPSGEVSVKVYNGVPTTGTKLLIIGPGSSPELIESIVSDSLAEALKRV
jgi:G3E family GTPase